MSRRIVFLSCELLEFVCGLLSKSEEKYVLIELANVSFCCEVKETLLSFHVYNEVTSYHFHLAKSFYVVFCLCTAQPKIHLV